MSYTNHPTSIRQFVRDIVPNSFLPAIQRELVWGTEKIEALFDSITRGYPIGTLLLWNVRKPAIHEYSFYELVRDFDAEDPHNHKANLDERSECYGILDGQQRTTALLLGLKGSFRSRRPRKWRTSPDAWVTKRLYLNLLHKQAPNAEEHRFEFRFLSDDEAKESDESHYWFRIGEILQFENDQALREWRRGTAFASSNDFEDNLTALWKAIEHPTGISYFLESNQNLNEVLTIFVRMNMGGEPLSYSDLLLSLATATWKGHDAREEVYRLVDCLNRDCGAPFGFDKDLVLKALLVLNDGDVRFRTENIQRNAGLEARWEDAKRVLPLAVRLISGFGFEWQTLTANNAVIPVAYYLLKAQHVDRFLIANQSRAQRELIRTWLICVLLGRTFGRQSDQVLTRIRTVLKNVGPGSDFPLDAVLMKLKENQDLLFSAEAVENLIDQAGYGSPLAFQILALVSPVQMDPGMHYHVDHMHPRAHFTEETLKSAGMSEEDAKWASARYNSLPNLQLLPGTVNQSKLETPYEVWLNQQQNPQYYRELGLLSPHIALNLGAFRSFFGARRAVLIERLSSALPSISRTIISGIDNVQAISGNGEVTHP
jgi:uncharacterized protein with ParB-like and HNH nuclease domain